MKAISEEKKKIFDTYTHGLQYNILYVIMRPANGQHHRHHIALLKQKRSSKNCQTKLTCMLSHHGLQTALRQIDHPECLRPVHYSRQRDLIDRLPSLIYTFNTNRKFLQWIIASLLCL